MDFDGQRIENEEKPTKQILYTNTKLFGQDKFMLLLRL